MNDTPRKATMLATSHSAVSVTGRDSYIITKALSYAIEVIRALPEPRREASDAKDMQALLEHLVPDIEHRNHIASGVLSHLSPIQIG